MPVRGHVAGGLPVRLQRSRGGAGARRGCVSNPGSWCRSGRTQRGVPVPFGIAGTCPGGPGVSPVGARVAWGRGGGQGDVRGPGAGLCCVHKAGGLPVPGSAQAPRPEPTGHPQNRGWARTRCPSPGVLPLGGAASARGRYRLTGAPRPPVSRRRARPCGSCCSGCGSCRASGSRRTGSSRSEYRPRYRQRRGDGPRGRHPPGGRGHAGHPQRGTGSPVPIILHPVGTGPWGWLMSSSWQRDSAPDT